MENHSNNIPKTVLMKSNDNSSSFEFNLVDSPDVTNLTMKQFIENMPRQTVSLGHQTFLVDAVRKIDNEISSNNIENQ